jgi:phage-related baseplate assembly protein
MNPINFIEVDSKVIQTELINGFETEIGETLYPGDERRIFLLQETPIIVGLKNDINYTGNQNLLPFAEGEALDGLGILVGVSRLQAQKTLVDIQFTLSGVQVGNITIPAGTRITPDGTLYFATEADLVIIAGSTQGSVTARAVEAGSKYNGFVAGQIKTLVDPVAYVASVANNNTSYDGADIETDDNFRERIQLAPSSFSTAGPEGAYIYWAKTADINIEDVTVNSPSAGVVSLYVLMKNGQIPSQQILDKVFSIVSAKDKRPLTDNVNVNAAVAQTYDITLTYYISQANQAQETSIRALIENEGGSVDQYLAWQYGALGRDVNPDYLLSLMYKAGAFRIVISAPTFTAVDISHVAKLGAKTITYGGLI